MSGRRQTAVGTFCSLTGKQVPIGSTCDLHGTECLVRGWLSEPLGPRLSLRERLRRFLG